MKQVHRIVIFLLCMSGLNAQEGFNCKSHDGYIKEMTRNPAFKKNQEQLEEETKQLAAAKNTAAPPYIIPVVFHIIYTTNAGNISSAQITDQIAILNKEFKRLQADTSLTPVPFKSAASAFDVEFRLATIDPNGNCTSGINRVYNSLSGCSYAEDDVKALSYWPSTKYLNIWIVQSMHYSSSMSCVGGGYATFPGGPANLDGINIRGDLISNIGTAASNTQWGNFKGRYLIHELGHWFNLRHIWGDAPCGNDLVSDTPTAMSDNGGCPTFPHNAFSSCSGSNANGEMFTNYMDYTNGPCLNMFTAGQVTRMTACMNSNVSGRSNLWATTNLNATGTNNPYTYPPVSCVAQPEILPVGPLAICMGDSVKFTDNSFGGNSSSRTWNFNGASSANTSDSIVSVTYNTPGTYSVALTKQYLSSTKTRNNPNKVYVLDKDPNPNYFMPLFESFEDGSMFNSDWIVMDRDNDGNSWQYIGSTNFTGSGCVGIMNYNKPAPLTEDLISPAYDLTYVKNATVAFELHFAGQLTANYDKLVIYVSNNCGKTWNVLYNKSATTGLQTMSNNISTSYIPQPGSADWRKETFTIPNVWGSGVVRFKFSFTSGGGNNIFIDDIDVGGIITTGIGQNGNKGFIKVYPNPASESISVQCSIKNEQLMNVEVLDITGKEIQTMMVSKTIAEKATVDISMLANGIYFLKTKTNKGNTSVVKFIKQNQE